MFDKKLRNMNLDELIIHFRQSYNEMKSYVEKLNTDVKVSGQVQNEGRLSTVDIKNLEQSDNEINTKTQFLMLEIRPILENYPKKLDELKFLVHRLKLRHLAEISRIKRKFKADLDKKVDEAIKLEKEKSRKATEDIKNELEKSKSKWKNLTTKLKSEATKTEKAQMKAKKAEELAEEYQVETEKSKATIKALTHRHRSEVESLERERRREKQRADREKQRADSLQADLDAMRTRYKAERPINDNEANTRLKHRHDVLHWKFRTIEEMVSKLSRVGTPQEYVPPKNNGNNFNNEFNKQEDNIENLLETRLPFINSKTEVSSNERKRQGSATTRLPIVKGSQRKDEFDGKSSTKEKWSKPKVVPFEEKFISVTKEVTPIFLTEMRDENNIEKVNIVKTNIKEEIREDKFEKEGKIKEEKSSNGVDQVDTSYDTEKEEFEKQLLILKRKRTIKRRQKAMKK